ncbi:FHA domain-containing protein FhaB [Stieleria maiorica]|uniref:FHA domain-containing protein FhaB n=1 Tax=Stieleria maiorica TaxID=2795974 RepID=A0A5B9MQL7_9BACT|nr:FHA domain-containing protein [Stieleria maiorica]QEG02135.1 FHA domain-containing protein FhaB [Stieleria maiorica]
MTQTASAERRITIGRVADNTIVLDHANISGHHARLIIHGREIVLEDLGSTNGTSIGKVENKISRAKVEATDTVFFGSTAYQVHRLIELANQSDSTPAPSQVPSAPSSSGTAGKAGDGLRGLKFAAVAVALASCLALIFLVWRSGSNDGMGTPEQTTVDQRIVAAENNNATTAPSDRAPEKTPRAAENVLPEASGRESTPPDDSIGRSLFLIVCSDPENETPFRVGNGFSIGPNRIATSASVIDAIAELQANGFPNSFLYSPSAQQRWKIVSMKPHPQYIRWNEQARAARQTHDALFDQFESMPPKPEMFDKAKERLIEARMKAIEAMERKTAYDVGVITIDRATDHWLSSAMSSTSLRPKQKLVVAGYAFDHQDPFFDPAFPLVVSEMSCRVDRQLSGPGGSADRLLASATDVQSEYAFLGSPVMNAQGKVIAVYSRPGPSDNGDSQSEPPMFDAALIQRINEYDL